MNGRLDHDRITHGGDLEDFDRNLSTSLIYS